MADQSAILTSPNDTKGFTWTTAPLNAPVEVVGHPIVHLWVTSSAHDFDAIVFLEDVDSTGHSGYVTEGVLRASHRRLGKPPFDNFGLPWPESFKEDITPLPTGPAELVLDLHPTAKRFQAGHRIRVTVQGADRDTHLAVHPKPPPRVSIYHDTDHRSRIELPVLATTH